MAVTVEELRTHLADSTDYNIPTNEEYLTDPELQDCIDHTIDDFNTSTPILPKTYTGEDFPSHHLLLTGAMAEALKLTVLKELRREMQYSDGGIQSSVYYKSPQFLNLKNYIS